MSSDTEKMTPWYDPCQLIDTAKRTIISTTIGKYADPRAGTLGPRPGTFFDYSKHLWPSRFDFEEDKVEGERKEIWIDFAADVGDGWNPTYAVAYNLARPSLKIPGIADPLPRGEILFLGGDAVYPTANTGAYEARLELPYRFAFKAGLAKGNSPLNSELAQHPHIFALPGNHDWYDSLVSFRELFCSHIFNDRKFACDQETGQGGWRTRQKRSYFTLKLPHNWWLLAVDMQLTHNIDVPQLQYFKTIVEGRMQPGDKVILCVPEPFWTKYIKYQGLTQEFELKERSVRQLLRFCSDKGADIMAYMAGDLHHYRRFENDGEVQKITAGGGGAFLHPTHDFDFRKAKDDPTRSAHFDGFSLVGEYPDRGVSSKLDRKNFWFLLNNPTFGLMTAAIYFVLALLVRGTTGIDFTWYEALQTTIDRTIAEPLALFVVVFLLIGLIFFTDSNNKKFKWLGGFVHGLFHLIAAFLLGWLAYIASVSLSHSWDVPIPSTRHNLIWLVSVILISGTGGFLIGSVIMGLYLYVSLHFFGRHDNETFSAIKIQDFKNFLRLHIDTKGQLTIYPIKIEMVPRNWEPKDGYCEPSDGSAPELIEKPVVINGDTKT